MKFLQSLRILFFGPPKSLLEAEPPPPMQLLSDAQREALRREVRAHTWAEAGSDR